jgi:hypothetical protein
MLPAAVSAYVISGTDRTQASRLTSDEPDPMLVAQAGPELARVMTLVSQAKDLSLFGERVDAYSNEDGYTQYHIVRRPDAAQFVNDLRVAINSIPPRAAAAQGAVRIGILPTPGLTGTNYLRLGQVVALPPGVQLTPEQREQVRAVTERSMLLVAEGDHVVAINGRDPIARYHAMAQGPHLNATVPANAVLAGRITGPSFLPLFFGAKLPGMPEAHASEPLEFALTVERRGEGAHVVGQADSPIGTATELRQEWEMVQLYQAQMMQQMAAQQRAAQQGGAGMPGGGMARPRPQMAPQSLPEPPQLQLQAPQ